MKISATLAFVVAVTFASPGFAQTPPAPKAKAAPRAAQATPSPTPAPQADAAPANTPAAPGWVARCSSPSRDAPLECAVEQSAVLTKTGQVIVLLNIRVAGETRQPIAIIQLPLGLNLPAGAKLQVDDGKVSDLQIQTCEQRGCYANSPIPADMLAAMKSGKQLKVSFQNMAKESITIPMPLADFAAAYDKIK
ncbi:MULTISPECIES: invasion associated locus B family protein [unclassified Bradyrhizobium]|uniref:invasion associated locus B family protein n=1 Tax=unclassified Bradyrhizobium TaxID=2631580 RepID=UPI00289AF056|nr:MULTISPECIES: invasion associated locus B family protein [unclassified Bradyrhizobium]